MMYIYILCILSAFAVICLRAGTVSMEVACFSNNYSQTNLKFKLILL
jgi:hypothetical protein